MICSKTSTIWMAGSVRAAQIVQTCAHLPHPLFTTKSGRTAQVCQTRPPSVTIHSVRTALICQKETPRSPKFYPYHPDLLKISSVLMAYSARAAQIYETCGPLTPPLSPQNLSVPPRFAKSSLQFSLQICSYHPDCHKDGHVH